MSQPRVTLPLAIERSASAAPEVLAALSAISEHEPAQAANTLYELAQKYAPFQLQYGAKLVNPVELPYIVTPHGSWVFIDGESDPADFEEEALQGILGAIKDVYGQDLEPFSNYQAAEYHLEKQEVIWFSDYEDDGHEQGWTLTGLVTYLDPTSRLYQPYSYLGHPVAWESLMTPNTYLVWFLLPWMNNTKLMAVALPVCLEA